MSSGAQLPPLRTTGLERQGSQNCQLIQRVDCLVLRVRELRAREGRDGLCFLKQVAGPYG